MVKDRVEAKCGLVSKRHDMYVWNTPGKDFFLRGIYDYYMFLKSLDSNFESRLPEDKWVFKLE